MFSKEWLDWSLAGMRSSFGELGIRFQRGFDKILKCGVGVFVFIFYVLRTGAVCYKS